MQVVTGGWILFLLGTALSELPVQYHLFVYQSTHILLRFVHGLFSLLHILGFCSVTSPVAFLKQKKTTQLEHLKTIRSTLAFELLFWFLGTPWCLVSTWYRFWGLLLCLTFTGCFINLAGPDGTELEDA